MKALLEYEFEKDKIIFPMKKIIFCFLCYFILLLVNLLKGSDYFESIIKVKKCSTMYWSIIFSYLPIALLVTYIIGKLIYNEYQYRLTIGYPFYKSDIKWTTKLIILYPIYGLFAGCMAGFLGIGGGLILGPLLLDLGIHPIVSTATSNFLVVFISCATTSQYILLVSII